MIPPFLIRIKIQEEGKSDFGLWVPFFLLWPLILPLLLLVYLFLLLVSLFRLRPGRGILSVTALWALFCALRGLSVDVSGPRSSVKLFVW